MYEIFPRGVIPIRNLIIAHGVSGCSRLSTSQEIRWLLYKHFTPIDDNATIFKEMSNHFTKCDSLAYEKSISLESIEIQWYDVLQSDNQYLPHKDLTFFSDDVGIGHTFHLHKPIYPPTSVLLISYPILSVGTHYYQIEQQA